MAVTLYKLEINLENCHAEVCRTIIVPHDVGLDALHVIIQNVMGWRKIHSYYFCSGDKIYGRENCGDVNFRYARSYRLEQLVNARRKSFTYCYDMGDEWVHKIKVLDFSCKDGPAKRLFACVGGIGACPPEDVGGERGYKEFCISVNDPESADYERNRKWAYEESLYPVSQTWPDGFDLESADGKLMEYDSWYRKLKKRNKR